MIKMVFMKSLFKRRIAEQIFGRTVRQFQIFDFFEVDPGGVLRFPLRFGPGSQVEIKTGFPGSGNFVYGNADRVLKCEYRNSADFRFPRSDQFEFFRRIAFTDGQDMVDFPFRAENSVCFVRSYCDIPTAEIQRLSIHLGARKGDPERVIAQGELFRIGRGEPFAINADQAVRLEGKFLPVLLPLKFTETQNTLIEKSAVRSAKRGFVITVARVNPQFLSGLLIGSGEIAEEARQSAAVGIQGELSVRIDFQRFVSTDDGLIDDPRHKFFLSHDGCCLPFQFRFSGGQGKSCRHSAERDHGGKSKYGNFHRWFS